MKNLLIICGLLIVFSSCYNDKADKLYVAPPTTTCDTSNVTFSGTINPIIQSNCATNSSCHAQNASNGYDYSTYSGIYRNVKSGIFLPAIQHTGSLPFMPLNAPQLAACDIQKITIWINNGAQNN